jgi:hypothetical protein
LVLRYIDKASGCKKNFPQRQFFLIDTCWPMIWPEQFCRVDPGLYFDFSNLYFLQPFALPPSSGLPSPSLIFKSMQMASACARPSGARWLG